MIKSLINYSRGTFIVFTIIIIIGTVAKQFFSASFSEDPNPLWVLLFILVVIYSVQIFEFVLFYRHFLFSNYKIEGISRIKVIGSSFGVDLLLQLIVNLIFYRSLMIMGLSLLGLAVVFPFVIYWYLYALYRLKEIERTYFLGLMKASIMILVICLVLNAKLWLFIALGLVMLMSYAYFVIKIIQK